MKRLHRALLTSALGLALAVAPSAAPGVGDAIKNTKQIEDFAQIGAESWSDLQGRAVLVEFFAYW